MDFKFSKNTDISYYMTDKNGNLTLSALTGFFQDIAIEHSDSAGYTVKKLLDMSLGWVITNYHIIIERMPVYGEKVEIRTWSSALKHFLAERSFSITDINGNDIIKAVSMWSLINLVKRRPEAILPEMGKAYNVGTAAAIKNEKYRISNNRDNIISTFNLTVTRSQTDTNGHTNNTLYAAWASDMVPEEIYNNFKCTDFKITFRAESRANDSIVLKTYSFQNDDGVNIITDILNKDTDKILCTSASVWRN